MTEEEITRIPRSRMPWLFLAFGVGVIVLVLASTRIWEGNPEDFADDVKAVYAHCEGDEIRLLAAKHNLQLVFEPCGSNNFLHYQWSPNGLELYYQTNNGPWLLNGETQELRSLPVGFPISNAVWFTDDLIAFPEKGVKTYNIDVYDVRKNIINITSLQQIRPNSLVRGIEVDEVLFLAADREPAMNDKDDQPPESLYRLFANTGRVETAFPWLTESILDYTYNRHQDLLAYRTSEASGVVVAEGKTGTVLRSFPDKTRVSVSVDGRLWAIEGPGEAISIFNQKTEDERLDEEQADKERQPTESELVVPSYMPTEMQPPSLWILDTKSDTTILLPDVYGDEFQWYESTPYYSSYILWGMEDKEFNRNVVLTNLIPVLKDKGIEIDVAALHAPEDEEPAEE